jgi:hypothetical protein
VWIARTSRAHRDLAATRMIYGGFSIAIDPVARCHVGRLIAPRALTQHGAKVKS